MAESRDKKKLLHRVRRIRGQLEGIERALIEDHSPFKTLQSAAACRGALNGLMAEIIEAHIHELSESRTQAQRNSASELIDIVRTYLH